MATSLNKVQIIGNLGKDPEIRTVSTGDRVCHLTVATSERWKGKDGEFKERTEWHKITVWVPSLVKHLESARKGSRVYLEGQLQTEKWTDQQGVEKFRTVIMLRKPSDTIILMDKRDESVASQPEQEATYQAPAQDFGDEEIPF